MFHLLLFYTLLPFNQTISFVAYAQDKDSAKKAIFHEKEKIKDRINNYHNDFGGYKFVQRYSPMDPELADGKLRQEYFARAAIDFNETEYMLPEHLRNLAPEEYDAANLEIKALLSTVKAEHQRLSDDLLAAEENKLQAAKEETKKNKLQASKEEKRSKK